VETNLVAEDVADAAGRASLISLWSAGEVCRKCSGQALKRLPQNLSSDARERNEQRLRRKD